MYDFNYIIDKIQNASFEKVPFKHIYLENFLSDEHFNHIINSKQIKLKEFKSTEEMIEHISAKKYKPVTFPGCTSDIQKYLQWYNSNRTTSFKDQLLEGIGISFRMYEYEDTLLKELVEFLNSDKFHYAIKEKFEKVNPTRVETAIQKYLHGYEISPHPDIRKKCMTYMVNINPSENSEDLNIHTHYLKFKKDYEKIYDYWKSNEDVDRCWVPWDWCETVYRQTKNNSIVMFAPDNDTMHAVKADYDHLKTQRTQIYGNLWYEPYKAIVKDKSKVNPKNWKELIKVV